MEFILLREHELRIVLGLYMMQTTPFISPLRVNLALYSKIELKVWNPVQNSVVRDSEAMK